MSKRAEALAEAIHEVADIAVNFNGYADDSEESDRRSQSRDKLEAEISKVVAARG